MKTNLIALNWTALAFVLTFFTTSCDLFDKENPKPATNEITYNNTQYTLDESLMIKYGGISLYGSGSTHMNNDFYIANGEIVYNTNTHVVDDIRGSFGVYVELASAGATAFKTGTFTFIDSSNDNSLNEAQLETKYKNKSVFEDALVYIDTNGNGILSDDAPIKANGGIVKVSGSDNNYTLEFDLTLENGKTLKGKNASNFTPING